MGCTFGCTNPVVVAGFFRSAVAACATAAVGAAVLPCADGCATLFGGMHNARVFVEVLSVKAHGVGCAGELVAEPDTATGGDITLTRLELGRDATGVQGAVRAACAVGVRKSCARWDAFAQHTFEGRRTQFPPTEIMIGFDGKSIDLIAHTKKIKLVTLMNGRVEIAIRIGQQPIVRTVRIRGAGAGGTMRVRETVVVVVDVVARFGRGLAGQEHWLRSWVPHVIHRSAFARYWRGQWSRGGWRF